MKRPVVQTEPDPAPAEQEPAETEPVTLGDLLHMIGDEPTLPGFEVSDTPLPSPALRAMEPGSIAQSQIKSYTDATNEHARQQNERGGIFAQGKPEPTPPQPKPLTGDIMPPSRAGGDVRYESRIRVLDAWQYTGSVTTAPAYVDRNWIGWGDHDPIRRIEPGPCLRVPIAPDNPNVVLARIGDYVVHQEIIGDDGDIDERVEVWERNQFEKLFLPKVNPTSREPGSRDREAMSTPARKAGRVGS